ncbi:hypothetical protein DFH06DRAFT_1121755 [Mycena polygramma]|nr:hypothetical protein DFH06DRAFT_1121755 [Mycena polygramma]
MGKTKKTSKAAQKAKKRAAQSTSGLEEVRNAQSSATYLVPPTRPPDRVRSMSSTATAGSSEPASFSFPASSPLPSLTPSASGLPMDAESVTERFIRTSGSEGSKGSKGGSTQSSRHSSQRTAHGTSFVQQVIPPTPDDQHQELPRTSSHGSHGSRRTKSGSTKSGEMSETARTQRKAEKGRRNRADSIESAELREAAARSIKDQQANAAARDDDEARPHVWDDENIRAANAALARERQANEQSEEFRRRHAAFLRNEQILKSLRVEEDRQYAADIQAQVAQMDADRELAEELSTQTNISLERRRARLQQAQLAMAEEAAAIEAIDSRRKDVAESLCSAEEVIAEYLARQKSRAAKVVSVESDTNSSDSNTAEYLKHSAGIRKTHTFKDRVTIQRYRMAELAEHGESGIPDQGISWDASGKAFETHPARSRGSSVGTLGGKHNKTHASRRRQNDATGGQHSSPLSSLGRAAAESTQAPGKAPDHRQSGVPKGTPGRHEESSRKIPKEESGESREHRQSRQPMGGPTGGGDGGGSSSDSSSDGEDDSSDDSEDDDTSSRASYRDGSTDEEENSDSAWDQTPEEVISEISRKKEEGSSSHFHAAAGAGGAPPDDSSSSSSEDEKKHRPSKGPSRTPRRNPSESERHPPTSRVRDESGRDKRDSKRESRETTTTVPKDDGKRRGFRFVKRETGEFKKSPTGVRDGGERAKSSFVSKAPSGGTVKKTVECFKCGGPHYKDKCPQKDSPKLFAQREVVNDNSDSDDEEGDRSSAGQRKASKAPSEQLREAHEEEGNASDSSDGGYTLQEYSEYSLSDNDERCGAMWSRDIPELMEYDSDDSDGESESELHPPKGGGDNDGIRARSRKSREKWQTTSSETVIPLEWRTSCSQQETVDRYRQQLLG